MEVNVQVKPGAILPQYATQGSAGLDLIANNFKMYYSNGNKEPIEGERLQFLGPEEEGKERSVRTEVRLLHGERLLCGTGLRTEVPDNHEIQIRPRSGMALKQGVTVINTPGTIDSDYRGEIGVILVNNSPYDVVIKLGDKIAQAVLAKFENISWNVVDEISETQRGEGGFGHTGQ